MTKMVVGFRVELDAALFDRLEKAAERGNSPVEEMASALIVYGLAAIEKKTVDEFMAGIRAELEKE